MTQINRGRGLELQTMPNGYANSTSNVGNATESPTSPAEQYANSVSNCARRSPFTTLYPAPHYYHFSRFLKSPQSPSTPLQNGQDPCSSARSTPTLTPDTEEPYAWLHSLTAAAAEDQQVSLAGIERLNMSKTGDGKEAKILIMRGHASGEWISAAGAAFDVDPEFWVQHIMLRAAIGLPNNFTLPGLPSGSHGILHLRITTLGHMRRRTLHPNQQRVDQLRRDVRKSMQKYRERLKLENDWKLGESIVRHFSVHDEEHCSVEQDISVHVASYGRGWKAVVWLDVGSDLSFGSQGPWTDLPFKGCQWLPIVQLKHNLIMADTLIRSVTTDEEKVKTSPSTTLLHRAPCHNLYPSETAAALASPTLALSELFRFSASSERQVLNLIQEKIDFELEHVRLAEERSSGLSNLLYHQNMIERHIRSITRTVISLKTLYQTQYGDSDASVGATAESTQKSLLGDFQALLEDAGQMLKQCERGVTILLSNAQFVESQRAIEQSTEVTRLTRLAFIFIPLSYVASFFGMNFAEIGNDQLSIWVYFAVSVPLALLVFLSMRRELWLSLRIRTGGRQRVTDDGQYAQHMEHHSA